MFKKLFSLAMLCLWASFVWAQHTLTVSVYREKSSSISNAEPLHGATIRLEEVGTQQKSDVKGRATFTNLPAGTYQILITYLGFESHSQSIQLPAEQAITVYLKPTVFMAEEVIVNATRATENSATTYKNLSKADLEKNNLGQDLPYLLDQTPGVLVSSDAGAGVGYTGIRIRGSDPTRVNVTLNGIPLNNPESMGTFLVNLPDFVSSVDNIQIQRGVGTSTNGAGAFGASLNIQTTKLYAEPYAELDNSFGSYNTIKNTVKLGTGLMNGQFSFDGRLSQIKSDGYIDRAFSDLQSFFLTGAWHGKKSLLRANVFSGKEKTYQAWNGVPEEMLATNRRYNEFTYENQTDNYVQTHYQLHFSHQLAPRTNLNAALHYTRGEGYYEEYREEDRFSRYGLDNVSIGDSLITNTDLVRRRWLDNHFVGATYSLTHQISEPLNFTLGGAYNEYYGKHFGEVIWAQFASNSQLGDRYYEDDAVKKDFNIFGKFTYAPDAWSLFADLQYRKVIYTFLGYDRNLTQLDQTEVLHFFNPKVGVSYQINPQSSWYASFALANKEPVRDDYVDSSVDSRPHPEQLYNFESGYRLQTRGLNMGANVYGMFYKDQLIITGQINDVGEMIRQNVPKSYRIGIELDAAWQLAPSLTWAATAALSQNKILSFTEYLDLYDYSGQLALTYNRTDIALSPNFVASSEWTWALTPKFEAAFISKYVSRQYLDNTSAKERSLDPFFVNNLRFAYSTSYKSAKRIGVTVAVNNIFGEKYASNGYTWGHLNQDGSRAYYNYYYPQATANFLVGLHLGF